MNNSVINRHNWSEQDEKVLLDCVNWVDVTFPKGSESLVALGGKWEVVSIRMKNCGLDLTDESCKARFFKIKRRELHTVQAGMDIVSLLGTEFPQAEVKPLDKVELADQPVITSIQRRVLYLEGEIKHLKTQANTVMELNESLTKFFETFGIKVPQRNV